MATDAVTLVSVLKALNSFAGPQPHLAIILACEAWRRPAAIPFQLVWPATAEKPFQNLSLMLNNAMSASKSTSGKLEVRH